MGPTRQTFGASCARTKASQPSELSLFTLLFFLCRVFFYFLLIYEPKLSFDSSISALWESASILFEPSWLPYVCLSVHLSICLSVYLSVCLSVCISVCLLSYLSPRVSSSSGLPHKAKIIQVCPHGRSSYVSFSQKPLWSLRHRGCPV